MARIYTVDDSEWEEVRFINGYALFMEYLMMGVRGLGLLVITWTTAVLLGGFVSDLEKMDFWCLTGITLIQIAGVFNFLLKEKINDTVQSWWGFLMSAFASDDKGGTGVGMKRVVIRFVFLTIQVLVFGVILCALGIVYMLGMYISAGVSLWRLIEHDFGDAGRANQRPALEVLYIMAVVQGVLFGYKTIYVLVTGRSGLANEVGFYIDVDKGLIEEYIKETVEGCEKDLSFATGRNFVTYGVDLMMDAKSNEGFIAGIKVLGSAIEASNYGRCGRKVLAKYLLTRSSDSSSATIHRLLETVGPRSPYSRKIKEHGVRIMDIIGPCIRLEQFPQAIQCLCSVVDTSEYSTNLQRWGYNYEDAGHGLLLRTDDSYWELRRYANRYKDYERAELLEDYEKNYVKHILKERSSTVLKKLFQCLPCKRKEVEIERKENIRRRGFHQMLVRAMNIIYKLVAREDNISIMRTCVSNTVLHKITMLPLKLHRGNHDPCVDDDSKSALQMLEQCWVLTEWLLVALTTETSCNLSPLLPAAATPVAEGRQRRTSKEIIIEDEAEEGNEELLPRSMDGSALGSLVERTIKDSIQSTIKCIFDCLDCPLTQKRQAIQILLHLSLDISFIIKGSESRERRLRWMLLLILCSTSDDSKEWMVPSLKYRNKNCREFDGIRRLAGEKLWDLLREKHGQPSKEIPTDLQLVGLALEDLKSAFHDEPHDISIRTDAIIIMYGLCVAFTHYSEVLEFLVDAIPKVVQETLICCESMTTAERQKQATDDMEEGEVSQDNQDGCIDTQRLRKALASLCYGYMSYFGSSSTMRAKFEEIASKTCGEQGKSFLDFRRLLEQSIK